MSARTAAAATSPPADALTAPTAAVLALLSAMEAQPAGSPALGAYRRALRRKGEEIAALDVPGGLAVVEAAAITATPGQAQARRAALAAAWADLGHRSRKGDAA